ncbi:hypothetical protein Dsin_000327 [Dipteronia sinensis]|uniref:CCHC-type domain-containing protein n=1 Tax=Dipteronia sinensis TaxID=43782 RepID=A0AAE0B1R4_9ROSI|nr:hypothetical protein Dsin_000327 [Dipteronia sinensis]
MIGEVYGIDLGTVTEGSSHFLRVRVIVEVDKPLQRCRRVDLLGNGNVTTLLLRYERLMDYCFRCDRLGHVMDECVASVEEDREVSSNATRKLAVWLRASSPPKRSIRGVGSVELGNWGKYKGYDSSRSENWRKNTATTPSMDAGGNQGWRSRQHGIQEKSRSIGRRNGCMETRKDAIIIADRNAFWANKNWAQTVTLLPVIVGQCHQGILNWGPRLYSNKWTFKALMESAADKMDYLHDPKTGPLLGPVKDT